MARMLWTATDLEMLKMHYSDNLTADIMNFFVGRSICSVASAARIHGIKKSKVFHAKGLGGRLVSGNPKGVNNQFKKGSVPFNKGKKMTEWMSPENIEKSRKGCFKKGSVPHNTLPIGSERISTDGYIEIKVKHSNDLNHTENYEFKHRVLWQQHNGPIPEGMVIVIKGDRLNFTIGDLEMISKRENFIRNSQCDSAIVKKYLRIKDPEMVEKFIAEMPGIIELKRANLILNTQIKNHENNN